jgi:DNA helicase-2/ATP-dependent DNA helicase PcrA
MIAHEHPDYPKEADKLTETITHIQSYLNKHPPPVEVQAASSWSASVIRDDLLEQVEEMKQARQEPYLGRVDFLSQDTTNPEIFYIGKWAISELDIFSWQDTLVADLYYQNESERDNGKILLKRHFEINQDALIRIEDEYIDPSQTQLLGQMDASKFTDEFLRHLLQQSRAGQLREIVATIRARQYEIIKTSKDQLLVVQGAPGSGKTQIALHRVSYLLYHHKEIQPDQVLILGPNSIFMHYISQVLPALGNRRLVQRTFDAWLMERLGNRPNYEPPDHSLETLMDGDRELAKQVMFYRNAKNKGSLRMAQLLDRYVDWMYDQILTGKTGLVIQFREKGQAWGPVEISPDQIHNILNLENIRRLPFNRRREAVEHNLVRQISDLLVRTVPTRIVDEDNRKVLEARVEEQIRAYLADWRAQNLLVAYRRLLRNLGILRQVGTELFTDWDLVLIHQDAPTARTPFRFSDLAALLYLKILLDGIGDLIYDHIVIDEAQDLTPLHFKVLYEHSRTGSITVLGDLAQTIYPHHGLTEWEFLQELTVDNQPQIQTIQESYRSTEQIIAFANQLLHRIGYPDNQLARPIARPGLAPTLTVFQDQQTLVNQILNTISQEQMQERYSIAIVCKTVAGCRTLTEQLTKAGTKNYQLIDKADIEYAGQVVIIPAYLTKGLEFDVVILADADAEAYPNDLLHTQLLYVVITRAAHALYVYSVGQMAAALDQTTSKLTVTPFLPEANTYRPITIKEFVDQNPAWTMDKCVERLARNNWLWLMPEGRLDEAVLSILLSDFSRTSDVSLTEEEMQ